MATSAERMRALRERSAADFGDSRLARARTISRVIAEHGYEGAASTDHDQRAQAVNLFITDSRRLDRSG